MSAVRGEEEVVQGLRRRWIAEGERGHPDTSRLRYER